MPKVQIHSCDRDQEELASSTALLMQSRYAYFFLSPVLPSGKLFSEKEPPRAPLQPRLILTLFLLLLKVAGTAVQGHSCCVCDRGMHIQPLHFTADALYNGRIEELLYKALHVCTEGFALLATSNGVKLAGGSIHIWHRPTGALTFLRTALLLHMLAR